MSEYIEREAALNVVNGWRDQLIPTYGKNDEYVKCLETVAEHLELLHAVDVRPVVTCADCEHNNACLTQAFVEDCGKIPLDRNTFFCADGERTKNA